MANDPNWLGKFLSPNNTLGAPVSVPQIPRPMMPGPAPQVADADSMKASFERVLAAIRTYPQGSAAWNERAAALQDMHNRIFNLTGQVYSQGQWVKG